MNPRSSTCSQGSTIHMILFRRTMSKGPRMMHSMPPMFATTTNAPNLSSKLEEMSDWMAIFGGVLGFWGGVLALGAMFFIIVAIRRSWRQDMSYSSK